MEGPPKEVTDTINRRAEEVCNGGKKAGIIATDETGSSYHCGIIKSIGSREHEETIAHHLYEVLRDFDQCDVDVIFSEAFNTPRMGQAIMNRLLKAAGHKIIYTREEQK